MTTHATRFTRISVRSLLASALLAAPLLAGPLLPTAAQAGSNTLTITTPDGRTFTREAERSGPLGDRSGRVTWTGPDGRTTTRTFNRSYDPATRTFRREGQITGPRGRTAGVRATVRGGDGAYTREVERRGFNGATSRVFGEGRRVAPGRFEGRRTVTGPQGRTRSFDLRFSRD